jgi:hypothetical protein
MQKSIIIFFCCLVNLIHAQELTGSWLGVGKVANNADNGNAYLTELTLVQKGKTVTGTFNYYFRDSLFTQNVSGIYNPENRLLQLNTTKVIFYKSTNTAIGIDCLVKGSFTVRIARTESVLIGEMYATKDYQYTCPTISFKLKKENTYKPKPTPTQQDTTTQTEQPIKEETTLVKDTTKEETKENKEKKQEFRNRQKNYLKEIEVQNKQLKIEFYDNGAIDNDSISVFFNNNLVVPKSMLQHKAIEINITLNTQLPYNELSIFAESLGTIPPNTTAVIIYDGKKRYEILITSDFQKNGTIKLIYKPDIIN